MGEIRMYDLELDLVRDIRWLLIIGTQSTSGEQQLWGKLKAYPTIGFVSTDGNSLARGSPDENVFRRGPTIPLVKEMDAGQAVYSRARTRPEIGSFREILSCLVLYLFVKIQYDHERDRKYSLIDTILRVITTRRFHRSNRSIKRFINPPISQAINQIITQSVD